MAVTEMSKSLSSLLEDMTSPNLREFIAGNLALTAIFMTVLSLLFSGVLFLRRWYAAIPLAFLYALSLPLMFVLLLAYYVLVMPLVYIAYAIVSIPLTTIRDAQRTVTITRGDEQIDVRGVVVDHVVPLRGFLVVVASTLFAVLTKSLENF
jgi:hypothetical protein